MGLVHFFEWFPEQSEMESLIISLSSAEAARCGLPPAQYFFCEQFCPNPECECHEVLLTVVGNCFNGPLASLRVRFGDAGTVRVEPWPDAPQSQHCVKIVRLLGERLNRESALASQFRRHYALVKKRASRQSARRRLFAPLQSES